MDYLVCKQARKTRTRHLWCTRNQHHFLFSKVMHSKRQKKRNNLRKNCGVVQTSEKREKQIPSGRRRRQASVSIWRKHPNLQLSNNQNAVEFCSINARIQVLHTQHSKLLPRCNNGPRTVHATTNQNHTARNIWQIKFERHWGRCMGVLQNRQGRVQSTRSRQNIQRPAQKLLDKAGY